MNVDELKRNLRNVIERYRNKEEFTGEVCRDAMARDCLHVVEELQAENARLKAQVPKWHKVADGDLPTRSDMFCVLFHTESGKLIRSACFYFADDDGDSRFGEWEFDNVFRWCELPPTEDSSVNEKENG